MPNCKNCGVFFRWGENGPPWIKLDPNTDRPHVCSNPALGPGSEIIQSGKWRGWTFIEAADLQASVERKAKKEREERLKVFKSPYINEDGTLKDD